MGNAKIRWESNQKDAEATQRGQQPNYTYAAALMNECPFIYEEEKMVLLCVSGTIFANKGNINITNLRHFFFFYRML